MLLLRCQAPVFATNCYVVAPARGTSAVVVDPGAGVADAVDALLREHDLTVGAVLLTHAHPDHVWDAATVAGGAPVHVAAPDLYRLESPADHLGQGMAPMFTGLTPSGWTRPDRTGPLPARCLGEGGAEVVPGLVVRAVPAPGHTEGSTVLLVRGDLDAGSLRPEDGVDGPVEGEVLAAMTGDVLFAGTIGRTDLPGGDQRHMLSTLRLLATALPPTTWVLPGHGPASTLEHERSTNPYLREAMRLG